MLKAMPKQKETLQAKLRNKLSPIYGLSSLCLELENAEFKDQVIPMIVDTAKLIEVNRSKIDDLLKAIDAENKELEEEKNRALDVCREQIEKLTEKIEALEKLLL